MDVGNDRFVDLLLYIFLSAAFRQRQKQEFGTMLVNQKPATRAVFFFYSLALQATLVSSGLRPMPMHIG